MNTRLQLTCTICGTPLSGGLDTFGDIGEELCQDCWIHLPEMVQFAPSLLMTKSDSERLILVMDAEAWEEWNDDEDNFDKALSECGVMADGYCGYAGSEFCDWECPLLKFGFHGTEIDDDDEEAETR